MMPWLVVLYVLPGSLISLAFCAMAARGTPMPHPLDRLRRDRLALLIALTPITAPLLAAATLVKVAMDRLGQAWFDVFWEPHEPIMGRELTEDERRKAMRGLSAKSRSAIRQNSERTLRLLDEIEGSQ